MESRNILLVEPDVDTVDVLQVQYELMGHRLKTCRNAESAYKALENDIPDILLSEIVLPDQSGFDFAKSLRTNSRFDRTVFVAHSGYYKNTIMRDLLDSGFDAYALKPVDAQELIAIPNLLRSDRMSLCLLGCDLRSRSAELIEKSKEASMHLASAMERAKDIVDHAKKVVEYSRWNLERSKHSRLIFGSDRISTADKTVP